MSSVSPLVLDRRSRWSPATPFVVGSAFAVVAGGLVAAVTGPMALARGSWLAAFLVLVLGVAQLGLLWGLAELAESPRSRREIARAAVPWNLGGVLVMAGTLAGSVWVVAVGSAMVLFALGVCDRMVTTRAVPDRSRRGHRLVQLYRAVVLTLSASVGVGMLLSVLRHR